MPIIRSLSTAVASSGLPLERGGSSVVGRGRSGCGESELRLNSQKKQIYIYIYIFDSFDYLIYNIYKLIFDSLRLTSLLNISICTYILHDISDLSNFWG